jgi:hypothetical protein
MSDFIIDSLEKIQSCLMVATLKVSQDHLSLYYCKITTLFQIALDTATKQNNETLKVSVRGKYHRLLERGAFLSDHFRAMWNWLNMSNFRGLLASLDDQFFTYIFERYSVNSIRFNLSGRILI